MRKFVAHMPVTPTVGAFKVGFYMGGNGYSVDALFEDVDWEELVKGHINRAFPALREVSFLVTIEMDLGDPEDRERYEDSFKSRLSELAKETKVIWDDASSRRPPPSNKKPDPERLAKFVRMWNDVNGDTLPFTPPED